MASQSSHRRPSEAAGIRDRRRPREPTTNRGSPRASTAWRPPSNARERSTSHPSGPSSPASRAGCVRRRGVRPPKPGPLRRPRRPSGFAPARSRRSIRATSTARSRETPILLGYGEDDPHVGPEHIAETVRLFERADATVDERCAIPRRATKSPTTSSRRSVRCSRPFDSSPWQSLSGENKESSRPRQIVASGSSACSSSSTVEGSRVPG